MEKLLSIKDVAGYLSVPAPSVYEWVRKRMLPFVRVGKHIRFYPEDIRNWLDANHTKSYTEVVYGSLQAGEFR